MIKTPRLTYLLLLLISFSSNAQTSLKANILTTPLGLPGIGVETKLADHVTFQFDVMASLWKSFNGAPQQFLMAIPELRYYTNKSNTGFFMGVHVGGSKFKIQKWNYLNTDKYQEGYNMLYGVTVGYQFVINERFNIEVFVGGGSQQGYYKGYLLSTGQRYDTPRNYNKSGEFVPYRGGCMLVYKL